MVGVLLTLFALVLTFLPLAPWSSWLVAGLLIFFYSGVVLRWFYPINRGYVLTALGLIALLVASALTGQHQPPNYAEVMRLSFIAGMIPLLGFLFSTIDRTIVVGVLTGALLLHAQWGITQFILQRDLGIYLLGESRLSSSLPGVAKFSLDQQQDHKLIRAYGPYAHANDFSGSLVFGYMTLGILFKNKNRFWFITGSFFLFFGIILSFSRASVLALFFYLGARWTRFSQALFLPFFILLLVMTPLFMARLNDSADRAASDRYQGVQWARGRISELRGQGAGPGNYTKVLREYFDHQGIAVEPWQVQPVHSIPVLLLAEWGAALTLLIAGGVAWLFLRHPRFEWLAVLPLLFFDHYLLTQTAPLVWGLVWVVAMIQEWSPTKR